MGKGISFSLRLDNTATQEALTRLEAGAQDMTELMDDIGARLVAGAVERISMTNVSPDGVPWPKSLRAQLEGGTTLVKSGLLKETINSHPQRDQVQVGTNEIYAAIHQFGGTITPKTSGKLRFTLADGRVAYAGEVTIPARPYLGISTDDENEIGELTAAYFNRLLAFE